jgi:hypothetical protein
MDKVPRNAISTLTPRNAIQFVVFSHSDFQVDSQRILRFSTLNLIQLRSFAVVSTAAPAIRSWRLSAATQ